MRDRLIELLKGTPDLWMPDLASEMISDYLLSNGVIVPPCKVGGTIYLIKDDCVCAGKVKSACMYTNTMRINGMYWNEDEQEWFDFTSPLCRFGKDVFLTKEEAEQALKERERSEP